MTASISDFFEGYISDLRLFSDAEVLTITSLAVPGIIKKRQYLLRQGELCRFYTLVCSGFLRSYRIDDKGNEHIFSFSPAGCWSGDPVSLVSGNPSQEFIDAIEDSTVIQLTSDSFKALLRDIPNFSQLNTMIITDEYCRSRERIHLMISNQAEEKYRNFIRLFPQLHQRIPIFMVASYLGIARETLTRIRSKMSDLQSL